MSTETYDRLWTETWGDQQQHGPVHRRQREALMAMIAKLDVQTVLDAGCGFGDNLAAMAESMPHLKLTGTDISREALAVTARRVPQANLQRVDIQTEALNEHFDLV